MRSDAASRAEVQGLVVQRSAASPESWVVRGSSEIVLLKQVVPLVVTPTLIKSPSFSSVDPPNDPTRLSRADMVLPPVGEIGISLLHPTLHVKAFLIPSDKKKKKNPFKSNK